jgi:hypothetical protein
MIQQLIPLLHDASRDILAVTTDSLDFTIAAFERMRDAGLLRHLLGRDKRDDHAAVVAANAAARARLAEAINAYETDRRLELVRPFAHLFDPQTHIEGEDTITRPTQRVRCPAVPGAGSCDDLLHRASSGHRPTCTLSSSSPAPARACSPRWSGSIASEIDCGSGSRDGAVVLPSPAWTAAVDPTRVTSQTRCGVRQRG